MDYDVYGVVHIPEDIAGRSGMYPLAKALGAKPLVHSLAWQNLSEKSWRLGDMLHRACTRYSGSEYYSLWPYFGEKSLLNRVDQRRPSVMHFIWAEFSLPTKKRWYKKRGVPVMGTFHCTPANVERILGCVKDFSVFDHITLMTNSIRPFFTERGYPDSDISVILHGVDTGFFCPDAEAGAVRGNDEGPLRGILVGSTDRDHAFMAKVLRALPEGCLRLSVLTRGNQKDHYRDIASATLLPKLGDEELRDAYRQSDLLIMPMVSCGANNAIMESMACGTPVLTNRTGGIPEYVSDDAGYILAEKNVDLWVDTLVRLSKDKGELESRRPAVRRWAERFDWNLQVNEYHGIFRKLLGLTGNILS
ncbi:MAG: glycosyltransferase family 4 protein [Verrucomicrobia bacterium]|nr:glycosyltransferase family 4 protein [Verrucomicrobiota bacterium]